MRAPRLLLLALAAASAFTTAHAHAVTVCRYVEPVGGACVEANTPGSGGPTLRTSCGGTYWDCVTITIP